MTPKRSAGRPKADPARDLRSDLLRTSRTLLDEGGAAALSVREVARRTGCTHQAPYHYFEDREAILAALVADGFDDLARRLQQANALARTKGSRAVLVASATAYLEFALSQPGVFRIMFRPDVCNPKRFPAVLEAAAKARAELDQLTRICYRDKAGPAKAIILWAHVHGLSSLLVDGPLALPDAPAALQADQLHALAEQLADFALGPAKARRAGPAV